MNMQDAFPLVATTLFGLEPVLARELTDLGAEDISILNRAVRFNGDLAFLYKANLCLRTALHILKPLHSFEARNADDLYQGVQSFDWAKVMSVDHTFAIDAVAFSPHFPHSHFAALKAKDAIADQFRAHTGKRPSIDIQNPLIRIHLYISDTQVSLSLDSSGESLHRRGYRLNEHRAPLNEALAAGLVLLTGWDGQANFVDPMCGSGTIAIEAGLIATHTPPGIFRRSFGFRNWKNFDFALWQKVKNEAKRQIKPSDAKIYASDISAGNLDIARQSVKNAGIEKLIHLSQQDFLTLPPPAGGGVAVMNPPYGERLRHDDIESFYQNIGDRMKKSWPGYKVWILSSNSAAMKRVGLRPEKKIQVFNGSLECRFHGYSIFEGSRKDQNTTNYQN
ncbi:MAG: THUMP domain-containing protein [Bacteroidia bacterium]